jgi:hypothetical protein
MAASLFYYLDPTWILDSLESLIPGGRLVWSLLALVLLLLLAWVRWVMVLSSPH